MTAISRGYSQKNTRKFDKLRDLFYVHSKVETYVYWRTISADPLYVAQSEAVGDRCDTTLEYVSQWEVFRMLDNLQPTAAGLDGPPAWFLRGWYSAHILQNDRLLHPQYTRGSGKKLRSDHQTYLIAPKQHADYRPTYHTNYVQIDGANRGPHIPLSDVSRLAVGSRSVKADVPVRINGVARVRRTSSESTHSSTADRPSVAVSACRTYFTRLQRAADRVRQPTFQ